MSDWVIFYEDGTHIRGETQDDWVNVPDNGVQVVIEFSPPLSDPNREYNDKTTGYVECSAKRNDCTFYTGVDYYDPMNYGVIKSGTLLSNTDYFKIWDKAFAYQKE